MHRNARIAFIVFFILNLYHPGFAQTKPHVEIQLITNDLIAEVNLDKTRFLDWARSLTNKIDSLFTGDTGNRDIMILVSLHPDKDADVTLHARPAFPDDAFNRIKSSLQKNPGFRTELVDYSFVYLVRTNMGCPDNKAPFVPSYIDPNDLTRQQFRQANLAEKKTMLSAWARKESLPVIAAYLGKVDPKFAGVHNMGQILTEEIPRLRDPAYYIPSVAKLTDSLPAYWRAVMEMSPGNEIIPLSKTLLLCANEKFDFAREYCELIRPFGNEKSLASYFTLELSWRLEEFNKELKSRAERGLEQHDKGNYSGALAIYKHILEDYPNSAWIHYETFFSSSLKHLREDKDTLASKADWDKSKDLIYNCNPLYPVCAQANTGKTAYLMFRRAELSELFKKKENFSKDVVRLADISLDLGQYGYAAETYWLAFSRIKKEEIGNRELLPCCFYCLEKLGNSETRKSFTGDFEKEFKRIEKENKKRMEESPAYRAFKKRD